MKVTVSDIYGALDAAAPFCTQEGYDNSGLLVGSGTDEVRHVLLALDITIPVVEEAATLGAELIISHHPVIWGGLKSISDAHPVWHLIRHKIDAIASHTCMDVAQGGTNTLIEQILREQIGLRGECAPLCVLSGGRVLGYCCDLQAECDAAALSGRLQAAFGEQGLRYYDNGKTIRRVAWCSGSGGDLIADALLCGADALITGDVKHSEWCEAVNRGVAVFDCGHFSTEQPVLERFREILLEAFPRLAVSVTGQFRAPVYRIAE